MTNCGASPQLHAWGARGHTLQANRGGDEAFLRLIQANVTLQDRAHFFALASRLMRRVFGRSCQIALRIKRNAGEPNLLPAAKFRCRRARRTRSRAWWQLEPRLAQVIELHYFGGLTSNRSPEAAARLDRDRASRQSGSRAPGCSTR